MASEDLSPEEEAELERLERLELAELEKEFEPPSPGLGDLAASLPKRVEGPQTIDQAIASAQQDVQVAERRDQLLGETIPKIGLETAGSILGGGLATKGIPMLAKVAGAKVAPFLPALAKVFTPAAESVGGAAVSEGMETVGMVPPDQMGFLEKASLNAAASYGIAGLQALPTVYQAGKVATKRVGDWARSGLTKRAAVDRTARAGGVYNATIREKVLTPTETSRVSSLKNAEPILEAAGVWDGRLVFNPKTRSFDYPGGKPPTPSENYPQGFGLETVRDHLWSGSASGKANLEAIVGVQNEITKNYDDALRALKKIEERQPSASSLGSEWRGINIDDLGPRFNDLRARLSDLEKSFATRGASVEGKDLLNEFYKDIANYGADFEPLPRNFIEKMSRKNLGEISLETAQTMRRDINAALSNAKAYDDAVAANMVQNQNPSANATNKNFIMVLEEMNDVLDATMQAKMRSIKDGVERYGDQLNFTIKDKVTDDPEVLRRMNQYYGALKEWGGHLNYTVEDILGSSRRVSPGSLNDKLTSRVRAGIEAVEEVVIPKAGRPAVEMEKVLKEIQRVRAIKFSQKPDWTTAPRTISGSLGSPVIRQAIVAALRPSMGYSQAPDEVVLDAASDAEIEAAVASIMQQSPDQALSLFGPSPIPGVKTFYNGKIIDPKERDLFAGMVLSPMIGDAEALSSHKQRAKALNSIHKALNTLRKDGVVTPVDFPIEEKAGVGVVGGQEMPLFIGPMGQSQLSASEPAPTVTTVADGLKRMDYDY